MNKGSPILKQKHGFTLIEVIVVIAIIGITSVIVIVGLSTQKTHRDLQEASHQIAAILREAQNDALTGRSTGVGSTACRYFVRFDTVSTYSLNYWNKSAAGCGGAGWGPLASYTLPAGVQFSAVLMSFIPGGAGFDLPRGETVWYNNVWNGVSSWNPFTGSKAIVVTKNGINYAVCFYQSGRIEEVGTGNCP